jgi:1-deoxy-D-xylulose-5-phosphate reductoisomerase
MCELTPAPIANLTESYKAIGVGGVVCLLTMKRIAILGSTGSIGRNALEVVRNFVDKFQVLALTANSNHRILLRQIAEFQPKFACIGDVNAERNLEKKINSRTKLFFGKDGLEKIVSDKQIDIVLLAISGSAALLPLLKAIDAGKDVALASKEALVMAGPLITKRAKLKGVKIIPIDSEQSAIWQCLEGQDRNKLKNIYLTASGGPFWQSSRKKLKRVSIAKVLKHPRWKMGKKVSVDSANLMNKGLEVLEAMYLFNVGPKNIKVVIHPEAIIHSMVEFIDGVILAQLSFTDMRIPIQYALSYPVRLSSRFPRVDFYRLKSLNFQRPDFKRFPCLKLAYQAAEDGATSPCVLNAANEITVEEFLKGRLDFVSIPLIIEKVLRQHRKINHPDLGDILEVDRWAKVKTRRIIQQRRCFH